MFARRLEAGLDHPLARGASLVWEGAADRRVARPVALPAGLAVVGVGGATLGGAGKTPLAVALARALHEAGLATALVGHAYRASPRRARVVAPLDPVAEVGDDALFAARALSSRPVPVVVGLGRAEGLALAARLGAAVAIVDGLLQTSPRGLACSVLVLDGARPWGSGACPPAGDLRASRGALVAHADVLAHVAHEGAALAPDLPAFAVAVPARARVPRREELAGRRVGLLVAVAHPERVVSSLAHLGVALAPHRVVTLADHAPGAELVRAAASRPDVDVWLTTARCATKLPPTVEGRPVLPVDLELDVSALARAVRARLESTVRQALPALRETDPCMLGCGA